MLTKVHTLDICAAALEYHNQCFSVIPCLKDKRPVLRWQDYTQKRATESEIIHWFCELQYQSIGVVLGEISQNVVVVDLDGIGATKQFYARFPEYTENTRVILTGSREGVHLYFKVDTVPDNINVRVENVGGFELRGNGQYVIAPPSPHPSRYRYSIRRDKPILHLKPHEIDEIRRWFESMRTSSQAEQNETIQQMARPTIVKAPERKKAYLQAVVSREIARVETSLPGKRNDSLFYAGLRLANYAAGGELIWNEMVVKLAHAARSVGIPERETQRTIQSAWLIGSKYPRKVD